MAYLEILKLELKIIEEDLREIIWQENKEEMEKENISDFKIQLLRDRFEVLGKKGIFLIKISFVISGVARIFSEDKIEVEFEKVNFLSLLSLSTARLVTDILKKNPPGITRGKENSIIVDIGNISPSPYPLKIKLKKLELLPGYILLKA